MGLIFIDLYMWNMYSLNFLNYVPQYFLFNLFSSETKSRVLNIISKMERSHVFLSEIPKFWLDMMEIFIFLKIGYVITEVWVKKSCKASDSIHHTFM